jgi:hypothetical protein
MYIVINLYNQINSFSGRNAVVHLRCHLKLSLHYFSFVWFIYHGVCYCRWLLDHYHLYTNTMLWRVTQIGFNLILKCGNNNYLDWVTKTDIDL